ncbi:MAG: hypothetical protein SPJ51_05635 [Candidatus Enterosoma sp.]|nr:hypothetical protein [Candidatus Enterosoma sp.]
MMWLFTNMGISKITIYECHALEVLSGNNAIQRFFCFFLIKDSLVLLMNR